MTRATTSWADADRSRWSTVNPLLLLLEATLAENDHLKGQISDLEQALQLDKISNVQSAFGVSETLAQMLIILADGKPRNKENLHGALYRDRLGGEAPDTKIIDTISCKLRKHVKPYGIEIKTVFGNGYRIVAGLDAVRAAIETGDATVVPVTVVEPETSLREPTEAERAEAARLRKQKRDRQRKKRIREAQGKKDRQTYLQTSLSRQQPWVELGISRRWWEMRRRFASSAQPDRPANDDTLAKKQISDSVAA